MEAHFSTTRRVEFCETDLAGIVHFSNFYRYMEQAEHEFFRSIGLKITGKLSNGVTFGWPRVDARCSYNAPARYDDVIEIHLTILRLASRSLTMRYEFRRDGMLLATGEMKTVFCVVDDSGQLKSAQLPDDVAVRLGQAGHVAPPDSPSA